MKLSVIIPTLGRIKEVHDLLSSMSEIMDYEHEIIIVDQNFNNSLDSIVNIYAINYNIKHYKVDFRGLSKAKNFGIEKANGNYICFPDDDSKFFSDTIKTALDYLMNSTNIDIVFGKCIDENGLDSVINFVKTESFLTIDNFEGRFIEATMFARTSILKIDKFDENLGIGAFFGAEEGYDLIFRLLKKDIIMFYSPNIRFYHPQTSKNYSSINSLKRVYEYRKGYSYVCLKHKLYKRLIKRMIIVQFGVIFYFFCNRSKAKYYIIELQSLFIGLLFANQKKD